MHKYINNIVVGHDKLIHFFEDMRENFKPMLMCLLKWIDFLKNNV